MTSLAQKITPFLWFDNQAEEAVNFYTSIFNNSKVGNVSRYDEASAQASGQSAGSLLTVEFEIAGYKFVGLNGGPVFKFTPAISFFVNCKTADEVQNLWDKLSVGGKTLMPLDSYFFSEKYGWVEDKFGVSWQLILSQGESEQKIIPSMMFVGDGCGRAKEAIDFYTSLFGNSTVISTFPYGAGQEPDKEGTLAYADFKLEGQLFAAMDSAHEHRFTFNEAVSFMVNCNTQEEVDYFWARLSAVPESEQCGWLKDKFGVSWQIVPVALFKLMSDPDPVKSQRVTQAMLQMKKIDIKALEKAYEQG